MMQRAAVKVCLASLAVLTTLVPSAASAATWTAFGPEVVVRGTGAPTQVTRMFSVLNPNATYVLEIQRSPARPSPQSGLAITLNGARVVMLPESSSLPIYTSPVRLIPANQLVIELRGAPGDRVTIKIIGVDVDAPTISGVVTPTPPASGWLKTSATVTFTCADATSGIASCTSPVTVNTEGATQIVTGTATDNAGNQASTSVTVSIDKTAPTIQATLNPQPNAAGWNTGPVTVTFTCADGLSGIASCTPPVTVSTPGSQDGQRNRRSTRPAIKHRSTRTVKVATALFTLRNYGGKCLDAGPLPQAGGGVYLNTCNGSAGQQFRVEEMTPQPSRTVVCRLDGDRNRPMTLAGHRRWVRQWRPSRRAAETAGADGRQLDQHEHSTLRPRRRQHHCGLGSQLCRAGRQRARRHRHADRAAEAQAGGCRVLGFPGDRRIGRGSDEGLRARGDGVRSAAPPPAAASGAAAGGLPARGSRHACWAGNGRSRSRPEPCSTSRACTRCRCLRRHPSRRPAGNQSSARDCARRSTATQNNPDERAGREHDGDERQGRSNHRAQTRRAEPAGPITTCRPRTRSWRTTAAASSTCERSSTTTTSPAGLGPPCEVNGEDQDDFAECDLAPPQFLERVGAAQFPPSQSRSRRRDTAWSRAAAASRSSKANTFLANRHAIAASGGRANRVLRPLQPGAVGSAAATGYGPFNWHTHDFDQHGNGDNGFGGDWRQVSTGNLPTTPSSGRIGRTTRSTFLPLLQDRLLTRTYRSAERGAFGGLQAEQYLPSALYDVGNRGREHPGRTISVRQGHIPPTNSAAGDFDGDGIDDLFLATGSVVVLLVGWRAGVAVSERQPGAALVAAVRRFRWRWPDGRRGRQRRGSARLVGRRVELGAAQRRAWIRRRSGGRQVRLRLSRRSAGRSFLCEWRELVRVVRRFGAIPRDADVGLPGARAALRRLRHRRRDGRLRDHRRHLAGELQRDLVLDAARGIADHLDRQPVRRGLRW